MTYNPTNPNGQATSANSQPVVVASDQSAVPVSGTVGITTNSSVNVSQIAGTTTDVNSGTKSAGTQRVVLATDQPQLTNALKVDGSAVTQPVSGTISASQSGTWTVQPGNTANTTPWLAKINDGTNSITVKAGSTAAAAGDTSQVVALSPNSPVPAGTNAIGSVNLAPTATGGWSVSSQTSLTSTATVSSAAGKFGGYMFINLNSAPAYIQVFDTTGAVTLGTTTPTFVIPLPANGTPANGLGANLEITVGIGITNGIKVAATTTATGATTVTTGLTGFVLYK